MNAGKSSDGIEANDFSNQEFPSEVIKEILNKVTDINQEGTAYTLITENSATSTSLTRQERLVSVFERGVLNANWLKEDLDKISLSHKVHTGTPVDEVHKNRRGDVFFNIVGRTSSAYAGTQFFGEPEVELPDQNEISHVLGDFSGPANKIAIIFDLNQYHPTYKEDERDTKSDNFISENRKPKSRTYTNQHFSKILDKEGFPKAGYDYGHLLAHRIPPRFFKGVIIADLDGKLENTINELLKVMKESPSGLLPIYDDKGNLLWPKKIAHEEIVEVSKKENVQDASVELTG